MKQSKTVGIIAAAFFLAGILGGTAKAEREHIKDITPLVNAKTSLVQAIGTVEQQNGGKAVKAEYRERNRTPVYVISTLSNGKGEKTLVDPMSGKTIGTVPEGLLGRLFDDEVRERAGITTSKLSLEAAVTMAEQQSGGKAIEADFKDKHGKPRFEIELVKDGTAQEIGIDGTSGQIIKTKIHEDEGDD